MSEYKVINYGSGYAVIRFGRVVCGFGDFDKPTAREVADTLNAETSNGSPKDSSMFDTIVRLRQRITELEAENAKLKADCASYDTELNRVAVAFLDATEKLQQVEAKESPALAETEAIVTPATENSVKAI